MSRSPSRGKVLTRLGRRRWGLLGVVALSLVPYASAWQVPFQFDDLGVIVQNPLLRSWAEAPALVSSKPTRSLTNLTFLVNHQLCHGSLSERPTRSESWSYHVVNVLLHALNGVLLYLLLRTLLSALPGAVPAAARGWVALFGAGLWAVHPVNSMAVVYVTQRYSLLAATVVLGTVLVYARLRLAQERGASTRQLEWESYGLVGCGVALALVTKENAAVLPAAVLLVEFMAFGARRWRSACGAFAVPLLGAGVGVALYGWAGFAARFFPQASERSGRFAYTVTQVPVLVRYLRLWLFPDDLSVEQDFPILWDASAGSWAFGDAAATVALAGLAHALLLTLGVLLYRRGHRLIPLALSWFYLLHLVEATTPLIDPMVEHRVYLPAVFLGAALAVAVARAWPGLSAWSPRARGAPVIAGLLASLLLVSGTQARVQVWRSPVALWADAVSKRPSCPRALGNLGASLIEEGRFVEALEPCWASVSIGSRQVESWSNLGRVYLELRQWREAEHCLKAALWIHHEVRKSPAVSSAWNNLGLVYWRQLAARHERLSDSEEEALLEQALRCFGEALRAEPNLVIAWVHQARVELNLARLTTSARSRRQHARMGLASIERARRLAVESDKQLDEHGLRRDELLLQKLLAGS